MTGRQRQKPVKKALSRGSQTTWHAKYAKGESGNILQVARVEEET